MEGLPTPLRRLGDFEGQAALCEGGLPAVALA